MSYCKKVFYFLMSIGCLQAYAQTADLIIQKTGPTNIVYGAPMTYTIKISNNGPTSVNNASFNDTLPLGVSNVTLATCTATGGAVCPTSSSYSISSIYFNSNYYSLFKGIIPELPVNSSVTFTITLNAPTNTALSSISNSAYVKTPGTITDPDLTTNASTWNTALYKGTVDISVTNTVDDNKGYACANLPKSYNYTVKWINRGPINVSNVNLYDYIMAQDVVVTGNSVHFIYPMTVTNLLWKASPGSSVTNNSSGNNNTLDLYYNSYNITVRRFSGIANYFERGDTITLTFTLTVGAPTTSCSGTIAWNLDNYASLSTDNASATDVNPRNDTSTVRSSRMTCSANNQPPNVDVKVIKTVDNTKGGPPDSLPKRYTFTVKWINQSPHPIDAFELFDQMNVTDLFVTGLGNALYDYAWYIIDLSWYSSPGTQTPTGGFTRSSGRIVLPDGYLVFPPCRHTVPIFEAGDTIILTYTFVLEKPLINGCGRGISFGIKNTGGYSAECIRDVNPRNDTMTCGIGMFYATTTPCLNTDLKVTKKVSDTKGYTCDKLPKSYDYTVKWINGGLITVDSIYIDDEMFFYNSFYTGTGNAMYKYRWKTSNVSWSSSFGSLDNNNPLFLSDSGYTNLPNSTRKKLLSTIINGFKPKDTITLKYTLTIEPPTVVGCGREVTWQIRNDVSISIRDSSKYFDTIRDNDYAYAYIDGFYINTTDLVISTAVNPAIVNDGDTLTITNEFYNASGTFSKPAIWLDTLPETFHIDMRTITCSRINGNSGCGRITYDSVTHVLKQEIDNMPANSGVKVTFKGVVSSLYTVTEYNKAKAYYACLDCVPSTNFTQSNYQINGECDSVFAGFDNDTFVANNSRDTLRLFNLLVGHPKAGGTWTRITGQGGIFLRDSAWFVLVPNIDSTVFMYSLPGNAPCPPDTAYIIIHALPKPPSDTIHINTFTKDTIIICEFLPPVINNISVLSCDSAKSGSSNVGSWHIDDQTKCLVYISHTTKQYDTLCINVCDTVTKICNESVFIIRINGVPPIANNDSSETTVNSPVTIAVLSNDISNDNDSIRFCSPEISITPKHGTITINSNGTITYTPQNDYEGLDSIQYIICDADGNDTAWLIIRIECSTENACCVIPNAFSPNDDGVNDIFRARCNCKIEEFYLVVYDRWGNKVFESRDPNVGWNGNQKNKRAQVEAYGYYMEYKSECSKEKVFKKGNVTLLE